MEILLVEEAIKKAKTLIEALGYIQKFRGKLVVIKIGGSVMENKSAMTDMLTDVAFLNTVGLKPVIIHGCGKAISQARERCNLEVQFVQGRRYTDQRTLNVVEHVLCNEINNQIVHQLQELGANAMGLHTLSSGVLFGEKLFIDQDGRKIDLGFVGCITSVNRKSIELLCKDQIVPVLAPLARDKSGMKLNCNADTAAGEVAASLKAEKFVVVSDTHGIRSNLDDPESTAATLSENQIKEMIANGIISGGMLPKVEACIKALDSGVTMAHIMYGRLPHSLRLEIFTERGVGTLIQK